MGSMTTGQYILLAVVFVLFVNTSVYLLRILWLLLSKLAASPLAILIGWEVWKRVISGSSDGLDPESSTEFVQLRRACIVSMAVLIVVMFGGMALLN